MKRFFSLVLGAALAVSLMSGCGNKAGQQTTDAEENEIRLGINYELSGEVATYGQSSVEGIELAVKQLNEKGGINGKQIKLIKYDNKSEPSEATSLATKLMTQDKVLAVMGPATSGSFKATIA